MDCLRKYLVLSLLLAGAASSLPMIIAVGQESPKPGDLTRPGQTVGSGTSADPSANADASLTPPRAPMKLDISRRNLKNFLTNEEASAPYRTSNGEIRDLEEVFMIGSVNAPYAVFWDPEACRLLGVLNLDPPKKVDADPVDADPVDADPVDADPVDADPVDADPVEEENKIEEKVGVVPPSPYLFLAEGPAPLFGSPGVFGKPRYFGFRLVGGMPEFLYTLGALSIEERIWLEEDGEVLKMRVAFREAPKGLKFTFPENWRSRIEASSGTWKGGVLSIPQDFGNEILFTYRLRDDKPEPSDSN